MKLQNITKKLIASILSLSMVFQITVFASTENDITKEKSFKIKSNYTTTKLIVRYKDNANRDDILWSVRWETGNLFLSTFKQLKHSKNTEVIDVNSTENIDISISAFQQQDGVEFVAVDYEVKSYDYSSEPMFSEQWGLENLGQTVNNVQGITGYDINVSPVWDLANGDGIIIGVLDTGVDISNSELVANIYTNPNEIAGNGIDDDNNGHIDDVNGWNFADNNNNIFSSATEDKHGTNVAGVIAAAANDSGIVGVAPKVKVLPIKFMKNGTGYTSDAIDAIEYAKAMGVTVINCSWGSLDYNYALKEAMSNSNILFICAAGNDGIGNTSYPASFVIPNVISVGAIDNQGNLTSNTSTGSRIDIYAPGKDIKTTDCNNGYSTVSGTSFSAAYVTGIAALVKQMVPGITTAELQLSIKQGVSKIGNNVLPVANASEAIKLALPINFLKDTEGRLSRAMRYADRLITPDVADIFTRQDIWSELDTAEKTTIRDFFTVTDTEMSDCEAMGLDIIDSCIVTLAAKRAGLSVETALALLNVYDNNQTFDNELQNLSDFQNRIELTNTEKLDVINLMQDGNKVLDIASANIVAKTKNWQLEDVLLLPDQTNDYDSISYTGEDKKNLLTLVERYHLNLEYLTDCLAANNITPFELLEDIYVWQEEHNFFIADNTVTAYTTSEPELNSFNQYKVNTGNSWDDGKVNIDKTDGMLTYSQPLISIAGKNGLNLNLGLRYDSEVSDSYSIAYAVDLVPHKYMVTEIDQFYFWNGFAHVRTPAGDITTTTNNITDVSTLATYKSLDGQQYFVGSNYYIRTIKITSATNGPVAPYFKPNFYETRYKLGVGVALDFPTVEIIGTHKYIHLPGGAKYKIKSDNTLDGYLLSDIIFGTATGADFTVNTIAAAYKLTDVNNTRYYFDTNGKYLGVKDNYGNSIQVYYNLTGDNAGFVDKIYDTSNRYIQFSYSIIPNTSRTVTITLYDNTTPTPGSQLLYTIVDTYNATIGKYLLSSIADSQSRAVQFGFGTYDSIVHFNACSSYLPAPATYNVTNQAIYLTSITSPTGAYTGYNYTNTTTYYGPASSKDYMRVNERFDKTSSGATLKYNVETFSYTYSNSLWRYTTNNIYPLSSNTASNYCLLNDIKEITNTNNNFRTTSIQVYRNTGNVKQTQTDIVSIDSYNQPTEVSEKIYATNGTDYTISVNNMTWDNYGNMLSSITKSGDSINGISSKIVAKSINSFNYANSKTIPTTVTSNTFYDADNTSPNYQHIYAVRSTRTFNSSYQPLTVLTSLYDLDTSGTGNTFVKDLSKHTFEYDSNNGNLITDTFIYSPDDANLTDTHKLLRTTSLLYDDKYSTHVKSSTISGVKDADNNTLADIVDQATYNMFGQTITSTDPADNITQYQYNSVGDCTQVTYPDSSISTAIYDYVNKNVKIINPDGTGSKTLYDVFGNVTYQYRLNSSDSGSYTTWDMVSEKRYESSGTPLSNKLIWEKNYLDTKFGPNANFNLTSYTYDFANRITQTLVGNPSGITIGKQTSEFANAVNPNQSFTGKYNTTTTTSFASLTDSTKNPVSKNYSDALGRTIGIDTKNISGGNYTDVIDYGSYNALTQVSGDTVSTTEYTPDQTGQDYKTSTGTNYGAPGESNYYSTHDGSGNVFNSKDANNNTTIIYYDSLGRVIEVDTPFDTYNGQTVYSKKKTYYNTAGQVSQVKETNNAIGATETFGKNTKYNYDSMGRVIKTEQVIDANNSQFTQNYYDSKGRLRRVYSNLNKALTINGLDNVTTNGDNSYSVTKYTYDFYGRLTTYTDGLNNSETYSYLDNSTGTDIDLTGRVNKKTLRNGDVFTYTYDNAGNTTQIDAVQTGKDSLRHTYTYDLLGNLLTAQEKNITTNTVTSTITYTYDINGNCKTETDVYGSSTYEKVYTYDGKHVLDFKLFVGTSGTGTLQSYERYGYYNDILQSLYYTGGYSYSIDNNNIDYHIFYTYDNNSNVTDRVAIVGNGLQQSYYEQYTYNKANLVTETIAQQCIPTSIQQFEETNQYQLDGNMKSKNVNRGTNNVQENNYTYDNIGRLTNELYKLNSNNQWQKGYAFDTDSLYLNGYKNSMSYTDYLNGNNNTTTTNTYNNANQMSNQRIRNYNDTITLHDYTFNYDSAGNLITKADNSITQMTYAYDSFNRMSSATPRMTPPTTYKYDALDRRYSKQFINIYTTTSLWNNGKIVEDITSSFSGTSKNLYIQGLFTEGVIKPYNDEYENECYDKFYINSFSTGGDVAATWLINDTNSASSYNFDAYGNKASGSSLPSPFSYKGYYTDGETGLFYLNARYYDPSIQQFTQEDTYWGDGTNLYGYCGANPVMFFDPSGHTKRDILSGFINALDDNLFASSARCILYLLKKIETHDSYDDAYDYYLGRTAGGIVSMAIGAGMTASGIMTIVGSITGGAALTIGSGGTLIIGGAAVSVQGVAIGAATAAVGGKISLAAAKNFGKDYSMMKSLKSSRGNKGAGKNQFVNLASEGRTKHILFGDATGGGHIWPGAPGKTPFPKGWSGDKIMHQVSDIVTDPNSNWVKNRVVKGVQRYEVVGTRGGVKIKVITDGKDIITAFPVK